MSDPIPLTLESLNARLARFMKFLRFCVRWIAKDRATQMASALAYRTLLGLLPVLIVATLIFKSVAGNNFAPMVADGLQGLGLQNMKIIAPGSDGKEVGMDEWLLGIVSDAAKLDLSALGIVGASVLLFSSIWVVITIEESFNMICRTAHGRSWTRRFITYWFALTAGPLLLGALPIVGSYVTASADMLPNWGWLLWVVRSLWGFFVLWLLLLLAYTAVPSSPPHFKFAAAGALVSALGLELGRHFLGLYVSKTLSLSLIYGSLGLVPVFMFWLYAMWLVVLGGLQAAVLWDVFGKRGWEQMAIDEGPTLADPGVAVAIMRHVVASYAKGTPATLASISQSVGLSSAITLLLMERLLGRGLLLYVADGEHYVPGRPGGEILMADALRVGFESCNGTLGCVDPSLQELRNAQVQSLANRTLALPEGG
ncbi:MAG: YihY family inner membrane protein [Planctomycetes bacterium]|nr:YihY family inner membrane protein [Planctomycetota bacterium]